MSKVHFLKKLKDYCHMEKILYIVMPAYNEAENIKQTIDAWYPIVEKHSANGHSRLTIINDGSKDNTYSIMQECAQTRPLFQPLSKPNGGHGSTVLYGYRNAIKYGADLIFQTDSDGQTNPSEFEAFWELMDTHDAVIGKRVIRGDGKIRKFVENTVCVLLKLIFGVTVKDANAPFRLMKTSLLEKYIDKLPMDYNLPNIIFTTYFVYFKENVIFKEITFNPRQGGTNSINLIKIIKIGWKAVCDFINLRREIEK